MKTTGRSWHCDDPVLHWAWSEQTSSTSRVIDLLPAGNSYVLTLRPCHVICSSPLTQHGVHRSLMSRRVVMTFVQEDMRLDWPVTMATCVWHVVPALQMHHFMIACRLRSCLVYHINTSTAVLQLLNTEIKYHSFSIKE